jgi:hypothetical protein
LNRAIGILSKLEPALRLAAVDAALPLARGSDAAVLVNIALELGQLDMRRGWQRQAERLWAQVTAGQDLANIRHDARKLLVRWGWKGRRELLPAIAKVVSQEWAGGMASVADSEDVEGTLRLAELSLQGDLAAAVVSVIIDGESSQAIRAGRVLLRAASEMDTEEISGRALRDAIAAACERFDEHRMGAVMVAAIHALSPAVRRMGKIEPLVVWFDRMTREPDAAFLAALRTKQDRVVESRCWEWMRFAPLAQACGQRWKEAIEAAELSQRGVMLMPAAWATHPCRQRGMKWKGSIACGLIGEGGDGGWAASCLVDHEDGDVATAILQSADARQSLRLASNGKLAACMDVALTAPQPISEFAADRMHALESPETRWDLLSRSSHQGVRAVAARACAFAGAWDQVIGIRDIQPAEWMDAAAIGLRQARLGGTGDWNGLSNVIQRGEVDKLISLVRLLRRSGNIDMVGDALLERMTQEMARNSAEETDGRVLAVLVSSCIFSDLPDEVRALLGRAAQSPNARVRSNAIEAACRWNRRHRENSLIELETFTTDAEHRPRATAVREIARQEEDMVSQSDGTAESAIPRVGSLLHALLSDDRPRHRLSGTWAAEHVLVALGPDRAGERWGELCDRLVEIADRDIEQGVRRRALAATKRLGAEIRLRSRRDVSELAAGLNGISPGRQA